MQKQLKSFDNVKINYDISRNSGNFVVFVHGAGGDLTAWKRERAFLHRKGISTLALDLRGHGKSERPNFQADYSLENFARDIHSIIRKEKISNFVIAGHCFGGMITIMFHKLFPRLAKSYILIDTTYKAPSQLKGIFRNHPLFLHILNHILKNDDLRKKHFSHVNYEKFVGSGDWDFFRIYSDISHTSFKSLLFTYENLAKFNGIKILRSIRKPVLIIEGDKDSIFNVLVAKKIKNLIRKSKLDIVPNANHVIVINNPKQLEVEILGFLLRLKEFRSNT